MLEGAVARILNQILGKYVVDLDTENLNVGIFSGRVELSDLKLNPEALYELNLPIEVVAGTIGKVSIQIPWTKIWDSTTVVNIEDVFMLVNPVINGNDFDENKNRRLRRAQKRKALADLDSESHLIGGPSSFSEHLISNVLSNLQFNVNNIHIRYEDRVSCRYPLSAGFCIGSITAETTNSKWKSAPSDSNKDKNFYMIRMEAFSIYCNPNINFTKWEFPSQYYTWKNSMVSSLRNHVMGDENLDFILKPTNSKFKITMSKSNTGNIQKIMGEFNVQDCHMQISKVQYDSICSVFASLRRMFNSWEFLSIRPNKSILENRKIWWKYAYQAVIEQRIKPYRWSAIKKTRENYRKYIRTYKQIILNPNDTELKLDLQKHEDHLSIINVVIARKQSRLLLKSSSIGEKNFWSMLPSPERLVLCEKIGFFNKSPDDRTEIDYKINFRVGNVSLTVTDNLKDICVLTMTQANWTWAPSITEKNIQLFFKVEGFIVEGATETEQMVTLISSEHLSNSPAYFLRIEYAELPKGFRASRRFKITMDSVEMVYNKYSFDILQKFLECEYFDKLLELQDVPSSLYSFIRRKLKDRWDMEFNIKIPFIVIPDTGNILLANHLLILDLGKHIVLTEMCQTTEIDECATQMELEEQLFTKLNIESRDIQVLLCNSSDNWREAKNENGSDMHVLSKCGFNATLAHCVQTLRAIPKIKFNINFSNIKFNLSERRIGIFLKYIKDIKIAEDIIIFTIIKPKFNFEKDLIQAYYPLGYLLDVQNNVSIREHLIQPRRKSRTNKSTKAATNTQRNSLDDRGREKKSESWARVVDLPGLEDNISPNNNLVILTRFILNEVCITFSKSSDTIDRQYLVLRIGLITMDLASMTYGPAYQISVKSILFTDKLHTTSSGQYLDIIYSPIPSNIDILTILFRKVTANCPDFWSHFHGVETSLVADFGNLNLLLHQESIHTLIKYSKYLINKITPQIPANLKSIISKSYTKLVGFFNRTTRVPVPPGSVKFSHSARLMDLNIRICDSDFDIINIQLAELEMDSLFRANERFVFRSFLSKILVEYLSEITLYNKILYTDEDKVFEMKYVRYASNLHNINDISPHYEDDLSNGSFKFHLGQIHFTFLYKLIVQMQSFVINVEAYYFLNKLISILRKTVKRATETFKKHSKINLSINLSGPLILVPQKSSSPNVLVLNTGDFHVENFFKESPYEVVENILLKWTEITLTRGVMTLQSSLKMQESLVVPFQLRMDIKKVMNDKMPLKSWDIYGIIDFIELTLGQKDISVILSIYAENMGEGKIIDLLPTSPVPPDCFAVNDEAVRNLEAFLCESRQENIVARVEIEGMMLSLFFDSGELLSSPVRNLNHGMCKIEINDISLYCKSLTDGSLDGKLSVDVMKITEIGPKSSAYNKNILQSSVDEYRNNDCNITVNKPPIIDINLHQTKNIDRNIDVIVGPLGLNLSVPFCEKLAMFILECFPKDVDIGFINHGYDEGDSVTESRGVPRYRKGLTISFRLNKPELIFYVESTSKSKRHFITRCEILADYSRHSNRLNIAISLSGLHTLFYETDSNFLDPYVVLRHCDIEFCKNYSEDKGTSISSSISSIYIQVSSAVIHSLNDILNDISEHFKIPAEELNQMKSQRKSSSLEEIEDLWVPRKLNEYVLKYSECTEIFHKKSHTHEVFVIPKFEIILMFEVEQIQILLLKSSIEASIYNWSELLNCTCEIALQANYFNEKMQCWEPLVEPIVFDEGEYKPWDILIKVFQDKALPMLHNEESKKKKKVVKPKASCTTTEDEDSGDDMIFLEPTNNFPHTSNRRVKNSLSTFLDDSDSENEEGSMEKLAAAISDLFTGDWNENEDSECEVSTDGDDSDEDVKPPEREDETIIYKKATYILIDSKEVLNITITPTVLNLLRDMFTAYSNKTLSIMDHKDSINLINDIGPQTTIEFYEKCNDSEAADILICTRAFENMDSGQNTPTRNTFSLNLDDNDDDSASEDYLERNYDFKTLTTLQFPELTTAELYERINKHYIKIHVPKFLPLQTNCSKKNWSKLLKLQSETAQSEEFYLAAKHTINKHGRKLVVGSPLNVKNETCHAINILYQPSVLQQLNLEPVGDVTNPFESTMRITVLEPHEEFNVPLFIAYHCKLFIQPAYVEGTYTSSGVWWKDLLSDLDAPFNLVCKNKDSNDANVFALRISMKRRLEFSKTNMLRIPNYTITLYPPLIITNYLPYSITIKNDKLRITAKIEPGDKSSFYNFNMANDYKLFVSTKCIGEVWSGVFSLTPHLDEKLFVLSSISPGNNKVLALNVRAEREKSCQVLLYASYWIVNKTGLPLKVQASGSNTILDSNLEDILLFTFKRHGKQTLSLKVYESNWSNEFGLECTGTTGLVVCKDIERKKKYLFFLSIVLSKMCPRLTRIVTILPSFLIRNDTTKHLRIMEENEKTDLWIDLAPQQTIIFWPETSSMQMYLKYRQSKVISQPFCISTPSKTVLRMDKGGAITVEVTGGVSDSFKIIFTEYNYGDAPILIQNYCEDLHLKIQQRDQSQVTLLSPAHSLLYTWDDSTKSRCLVWNVYNNKGTGFSLDINIDGYGEERIRFHSVTTSTTVSSSEDESDNSDSLCTAINNRVRSDKGVIYWICYRDGSQRTLLFTEEPRIYSHVLKTIFHEESNIEILLSMAGIGASIFTSESSKKEKVCLSLADIPATWEVNVGHKWKTLTLELASWVEDKYKLQNKKCQLKDYIHIDFEKMFMLKPFFAELRRTYSPALYFHVRKGDREQYFNLKVHTLQIDNKDSNSIILQPLPTLALRSSNPFIDFTVSKIISVDCSTYRFIKLAIGDFHLNIESDLLSELGTLMKNTRIYSRESQYNFARDMTAVHLPIDCFKKSEQTTIIEKFQCEGFSICLHIDNRKQLPVVNSNIHFNKILNFLFPMNISPYMPQEGVYHKICFIEELNMKTSFWQMSCDILEKILTQFLQQYYSHVLGLQVLVNTFAIQPFSLVKSSSCEPTQMASILYNGSRCLLGHINMSPAALEQSILDIFVNQNMECVQRIKRHGSYQKSDYLLRSINTSCRNFQSGVPIALNQLIIRRRNGGMSNEGEMFFRTTGKVLLSLVTRHPDEKTDCVDLAREALRRASILGEPIQIHQRLTRYRNTYLGVRPMSTYLSIGQYLLETIANSRFANDIYWGHVAIDKIGKSILLISLDHLVKINKCRLWGPWEIEWSIELDDILSMPQIVDGALILSLRPSKHRSSEILKIVGDKEAVKWLREKIEQAIIVSMDEKSWSLTGN